MSDDKVLMISEEAKATFVRDGVVIVRNIFADDRIWQFRENLQRYLLEVVPKIPKKDVFFQDKASREDLDGLLRLEKMHKHDAYYAGLLQEMVPTAKALLGEPVTAEGVSLFDKAAAIGEPTPPHQDGHYFMLEPNLAVTLWVPMEPADESNGCVRYVRGSHRCGLREHRPSNVFGFSLGVSDFGPQDLAHEIVAAVEPGDLIAHHSLTIHRTTANTSSRSRRALGLVYFGSRCVVDAKVRDAQTEKAHRRWRDKGRL